MGGQVAQCADLVSLALEHGAPAGNDVERHARVALDARSSLKRTALDRRVVRHNDEEVLVAVSARVAARAAAEEVDRLWPHHINDAGNRSVQSILCGDVHRDRIAQSRSRGTPWAADCNSHR